MQLTPTQLISNSELSAYLRSKDGKKVPGKSIFTLSHLFFRNIPSGDIENLLLETSEQESYLIDFFFPTLSPNFKLLINHTEDEQFNILDTGVGSSGKSMLSFSEPEAQVYKGLHLPPQCQLFIQLENESPLFMTLEPYHCISFEVK